jgi:hypothetical protein
MLTKLRVQPQNQAEKSQRILRSEEDKPPSSHEYAIVHWGSNSYVSTLVQLEFDAFAALLTFFRKHFLILPKKKAGKTV